MSTLPVRIPASVFTSPRRRKHSLKAFNVPSFKARVYSTDGPYVPQPSSEVYISNLRDAIMTLDSKITAMVNQRKELESQLEQAVRLQSPVLRLPSELLSSIFLIGVLGMGEENAIMVTTLMLVCRTWAEVALNTPLLWARIAVSPLDSIEKARRRLERSKQCPLEISIKFGPRLEYTSRVTEHVIRAMDLFRPALWRIKAFHLSVPNRPQAHAALSRCQEDAPILEELTIQVYHSMQDDHYSTVPATIFNGNTPRLRSCSLTSFNFGWDTKLLTRLRILKLGGYFNSFTPSTKVLLGILCQCPELEELALRNMPDVDTLSCPPMLNDSVFVSTCKMIQLPRLTKASFYYAGINLTKQILGQIAFPNLESLEMCYLENVTPIIQHLYVQGLTRLPLKYLRIESCLFNEMKFVNLLRHLPSLVTLDLVDVEDISSHFLRGLSSSQPWVCPRLQNVTLDGCTAMDWDSLRTFVESRLPANPHAYARYHSNPVTIMSSASESAAAHARSKIQQPRNNSHHVLQGPQRLRSIDVTRCNQISKEMVQWLRMYVAEVKCEPAKGLWGEPTTM